MARILQILSDWKWTGPAEPALNLCKALTAQGHHVRIACQPSPDPDRQSLPQNAEQGGFDPIVSLHLNPSLNLWAFLRDARALQDLVAQERFDVVHVHGDHDMLLARSALSGRGARPRAIVRSYHKAKLPGWLTLRLHRSAVDGVVTVSAAQRERFGRAFPAAAVGQSFGAVDLERFRPRPPTDEGRKLLGVSPQDVVVGVVARVQRHRRFDLFLKAVAIAVAQVPSLKAVVLGRGTHRHEVAIAPAQRMGLADRVLFPGYVSGEDYLEALAAFDVKVFLVPGSDGSCRAARELMAMGKPVVCTDRHPLPEIVEHNVSGLVTPEDPDALAAAIVELARSPERRESMGRAARARAEAEFSAARDLAAVEAVYAGVGRGGEPS